MKIKYREDVHIDIICIVYVYSPGAGIDNPLCPNF